MDRIKSLDGLRGLAAYTVVLSHFSNQSGILGGILGHGAGQVGVMLFFAMSGYLMARLYIRQPFSQARIAGFFQRRVARVLPLYLLVVLTSYFWTRSTGFHWPFYSVTGENLFAHLAMVRGDSVLWTIPVEVQFYLCVPLLWWAAERLGSSFVFLVLLLIGITSLAGMPQEPVMLSRVSFFLIGVLIAMLPDRAGGKWANAAFVIAFFAYVISFPQILGALGIEVTRPVWNFPLYPLIIGSLLTASVYSPLASTLFGTRLARFAGEISYSVYLLHMVILQLIWNTPLREHLLSAMIAFFGLTTLAAFLSWRFFEYPARGLINAIGGRQKDAIA